MAVVRIWAFAPGLSEDAVFKPDWAELVWPGLGESAEVGAGHTKNGLGVELVELV